MVRLSAILLLLTLLFNHCGYQVVLFYINQANTLRIEKDLDQKNYNDQELISIKTPLNLPYYSSSTQFERISGSITLHGKEYQYVKRRVFQDTLELLCLPNQVKTRINKVSGEIAASSAAESQTSPTEKGGNFKIDLPSYFQPVTTSPLHGMGGAIRDAFFSSNTNFIAHDYSFRPEIPPRTLCSSWVELYFVV